MTVHRSRRPQQARPLLDDPAQEEVLEIVGLVLMVALFLILVGVTP